MDFGVASYFHFLAFYTEFQTVYDFMHFFLLCACAFFLAKMSFLCSIGGHHSSTRGLPIPSVHIFLLQLRSGSGSDGTCKFPGRRLVCDPRWGGHGWVQDIIYLVPTLPGTGCRVNINHVWSPGHHCHSAQVTRLGKWSHAPPDTTS